MSNQEQSIDDLAQVLTGRFDRWDIWRNMDGDFVVTVWVDRRSKSVAKASLTEAIRSAAELKFLPAIQPEPIMNRFEVRKQDDDKASRWRVYSDSPIGWAVIKTEKTKRAAEEYMARLEEGQRHLMAEWNKEYGWTHDKVEGVDYEVVR